MSRSEYKSIVNAVVAFILSVVVAGYCSEIKTVQGTDIIKAISAPVDSCIFEINNKEYDNAKEMLEDISEFWRDFQIHQSKMFSDEIMQLEQLPGFFSDISEALDTTHGYAGKNEFTEALRALEFLQGFLPGFVEAINMPVLLDFTGPKCKACKTMKNRLLNIATDYEGKVRIAFVDVNKEKDLVKKYKIMLIPTLIFIARNGEEIERHIGDMEEWMIKTKLDRLIN